MGAHVSNTIRFLESMGANAAMARMSFAEYQAAVKGLSLEGDAQTGLLEKDVLKLNESLRNRETLYCLIFSPSEDEQPESPDQEGETPEETPASE
jgi:hypothetical protein